MDDQRFDRLTRALARGGSRRRLLGALVGGAGAALVGAVRGGGAAAQQGYLVDLGGACYDPGQCRQIVGEIDVGYVYCADNGFDYDGPYNCCLSDGGFCAIDEHCCGWNICVAHTCVDPAALEPPGFPAELQLGDPCNVDAECGQYGGPTYCAPNGSWDDGPLNCCHGEGSPCSNDTACCYDLFCGGGFCRSPW